MTDQQIKLYGANWCPDCRRAKQFFGENRISYKWIDITDNDEAIAYVEEANNGNRSIPTIVFPDGEILVEPSNAQLAEKTHTNSESVKNEYDVIVIGGGPAGMTAAIYTAREGLATLVIDASGIGGQAASTQVLDNFPGFPEGISGQEFSERMELQARRFGVDILQGEKIIDIVREDQQLTVKSENDRDYIGQAVLLTTGSRYRRLNIPGEDKLIGANIHFCATCDGAFYKNKDVLVVGGGNSGFEEGLFLAEQHAKSVTIVEFMPEVNASQILQDKVAQANNIEVFTNMAVKEFLYDDQTKFTGVLVENRTTGDVTEWHPDGVFVFIGLAPNSGFLPQTIQRDQWGFVTTDAILQTSMSGVFAAGDLRQGTTKQAVVAAGEGATAALMIRRYINNLDNTQPPTQQMETEALAAV